MTAAPERVDARRILRACGGATSERCILNADNQHVIVELQCASLQVCMLVVGGRRLMATCMGTPARSITP